MIISHKHKFIFFALPKTASQAIRKALQAHLGEDDWQQQNLYKEERLPIAELSCLAHGHISVSQIKGYLSGEQWCHYFKFAVVRNPFERFISACFFLNRKNPDFTQSPCEFMKYLLTKSTFRERILIRPQQSFLVDEQGEIAVDYLARHEDLQDNFQHICKEIGIKAELPANTNNSTHEDYRKYYDPVLASSVASLYRDDFHLFGYNTLPHGLGSNLQYCGS